jgi:hypothetical protein
LETAVQKVFEPLAEDLGCAWEKVVRRFEKFIEIKGRMINLRVYWHFERDPGLLCTLCRMREDGERLIELSLGVVISYKTGLDDTPDHQLATSKDPADLLKAVKAYAVSYLTSEQTDIEAVRDWSRKRTLQEHPEYANIKTNKSVRCEWID